MMIKHPEEAPLPKTEFQLALDEVLYATNRVIQLVWECGANPWTEAEAKDHERLVQHRDHIWAMIQRLDPTRRD